MSDHFCTYFDHRYAPKGLAMWQSLKRHRASATLHVLCLDDACLDILSALGLEDVHLHPLREIEDVDPELLRARANRSLVEYYFTLTPVLPLHLLTTWPGIERLTYVDADLFFFGDPQPLLNEVGEDAVGLIEHRFPDALLELEQYGRFNVGWVTFRNDPVALECLRSWREQCLDWCHDRLEAGRFAEQKYLDDWPARFRRVRIIRHQGANVAPWNLTRFPIAVDGGRVSAGGDPLVFFHAHGFEPEGPGHPRDANLAKYGVEPTPLLCRHVFEPYERALLDATSQMATPLALALLADRRSRDADALLETFKARVSSLEHQLSESEADRAARLEVIESLHAQLKISEAERATLSASIIELQDQLKFRDAREEERAAHAAIIDVQRQQLMSVQATVDALRAELDHLRARVQAMERSRSWRWTRPLRRVAGLAPGSRRPGDFR